MKDAPQNYPELYTVNFRETDFPGEKFRYIVPTASDMEHLTFNLIDKIAKSGSRKYDAVVTVANGGLSFVRFLADSFRTSDIYSYKLTTYDPHNPGVKYDNPILEKPLQYSLNGMNVLWFDDIVDDSITIRHAHNMLPMYGPRKVTTASVFCKPHAPVKPNFHAAETEAWIILPHERVESSDGLTNRWLLGGLNYGIIQERLIQMGLPQKEVILNLLLHNERREATNLLIDQWLAHEELDTQAIIERLKIEKMDKLEAETFVELYYKGIR